MKRHNLLLFISVITAIFFFSCTKSTIKTEEKNYTEKHFLSADTTKGAISVDLQIELPVDFKNKSILDSIRNVLVRNLFGENFVKISNDSVVEAFKSTIINEYLVNNKPLLEQINDLSSYSFENVYNLSGFGLLNDKHIFGYSIERYVYMGGAHGLETKNYFNFDLKNGKLITENDLFIPNFKDSLSKIIRNRIIEESRENNDKEPIFNLEETEYWTDSIKPNSNFYITDLGLKYVFNPYEIGPYNLGETEIFISFNSLKQLFKPDNPVNYLINKTEK